MNGDRSDRSGTTRQLGRGTESPATPSSTGYHNHIGLMNEISGGSMTERTPPVSRHGHAVSNPAPATARLPMIVPLSAANGGLTSPAMSGTGLPTPSTSTSGRNSSSQMMPPPQMPPSMTSHRNGVGSWTSYYGQQQQQGPMKLIRDNGTKPARAPPVVSTSSYQQQQQQPYRQQKQSMNSSNGHVITITGFGQRRLSGGVQPEVGLVESDGAATGAHNMIADMKPSPWQAVDNKPALPSLPSATTTLVASKLFTEEPRTTDHQHFPQSAFFGVPPLPPPRSGGAASMFGPGASPVMSARGGGKKRAMSSSTHSSDLGYDILSIARFSPTALVCGDETDFQSLHQHLQYRQGIARIPNVFLPGTGSVGHMSARDSLSSGSSHPLTSAGGPGVYSRQRQRPLFSSIGGSQRRGQRPGMPASSAYDGEDDDDIPESMWCMERGSQYDDVRQPMTADTPPSSNQIVVKHIFGGAHVTINKMPFIDGSGFSDLPEDANTYTGYDRESGGINEGWQSRRLPPPYDIACSRPSATEMAAEILSTGDEYFQSADIEHHLSQFGQLSSDFGSTTLTEDTASTSSGLIHECVCRWLNCDQLFFSQDELVQHLEREHIDQRSAVIGSMIQSPGGATATSGAVADEFTCMWNGCKRQTRPFNARYKLLIHMRVHSGEKPHKCTADGCDKSFSRLENLKIHMRSHTGERPYVCSYEGCKKAFSNSSDRAKHQRTHIDTKPYACPVPNCDKRYTDPSSLRKHQKIHAAGGMQHLKKKVRTDNSDDCSTPNSAVGVTSTETAALNNLLSVHTVISKDLSGSVQQQQQQQQQRHHHPEMLFGQATFGDPRTTRSSTDGTSLPSTSSSQRPLLSTMAHTEHRQIVGGGFNSQSNGSLLTATMHRTPRATQANLTAGGTGHSSSLGTVMQVRRIHQNAPPPPYPSAAPEPENSQLWTSNNAQPNGLLLERRSSSTNDSSTTNIEFQSTASATSATEIGQGEYPFYPMYGSTSYRYIEQLYANDPVYTPSSTLSSSSVPVLPPLRRTSSCLQPPPYHQLSHPFNEYMPCNIQQRIAYGAIGTGGGGMYHSTGGSTSMYPQLLPDSLEQTLAGLPSDAMQFSDLADYTGFADFTVQELDCLTVHNG